MIKNNKKYLSVISAVLIFAMLLSFASCSMIDPTQDLLNQDSVARYLYDSEDVPEFDTNLFSAIEICFMSHYYIELEDSQTLGQKTVDAYYEFCAEEVDATSQKDVTLALIDCYIYAVGDKYAFYRTADEADDYTTDMSGSFVGIGVSVTYNILENTILVTGVEVDSPADRAGIKADDYIVAVDGARVTELGVTEAINKIKGEIGTTVNITILREDEEISMDIVREKITETTVSYEIIEESKIGYIKITGFKGNTASQFITAVDAVEDAGVESVIFDLRSNSGGYLSAVTTMLSYLVPTGTPIASFTNGKAQMFATEGTAYEEKDHVLSVPSVVLCNSASASAAELFTAAMRDYNDMDLLDSVIVGQVTYKKGIMQSTISFTDGSTLTLTTSFYNPPSGENFHGVGVTPDVLLPEDAEDEDYMQNAYAALDGIKGENTNP